MLVYQAGQINVLKEPWLSWLLSPAQHGDGRGPLRITALGQLPPGAAPGFSSRLL